MTKRILLISWILLFMPAISFASTTSAQLLNLHANNHSLALMGVLLFFLAYILVMTEEVTHLRKSKPVVLVAGIIWLIIGEICYQRGLTQEAAQAVRHYIIEFSELFMFLLVAMTYINALEERLVFEALRSWLVRHNFSYRQLFWITGTLSFILSPIADNLTTALLMCAVITAVGSESKPFIALSCINVVVAANAGGAFSPFGDITTLMVWQKNKLAINEFLYLFIPSVVSYLVPALLMFLAVPKHQPPQKHEIIKTRFGAKRIVILFVMTIATAMGFHHFFNLPPMMGMMTGLGYLNFFAYYLKKKESKKMHIDFQDAPSSAIDVLTESQPFDIFNKIKRAEWDTLFFFYGIILSIGGLATLGYLEYISNALYLQWGQSLSTAYQATPANIAMGFFSAIIDNIPVMFSVLTMDPSMPKGQWLLVTLTTGIGGSMLSIGSAAGVALMGQTRGIYTFLVHLKWSWAIILGYFAAVGTHLFLNQSLL
jgi:Na+/H+ antiporter NhaD/arsenite permease-like protein